MILRPLARCEILKPNQETQRWADIDKFLIRSRQEEKEK